MPGVHAVLTHDDVPGRKTYGLEFADQPVLAIDRVRYYGEAVAIVAAEQPEQARRAAAAVRVEYEPLEPVADPERATEMEPLHPDRPTMGHGYRDDPRPNVVRSHRHPARRSGRGGRRHGRGRLRRRPAGSGVPRSRVGDRDPGRRGRRRHPRRDPVAARRPRPGRAVPRARPGAGADPPRGGRRRVRRARGPLDADPRRAARAAHRSPREDRLQPRGVVRRPHPSPPGADLGRASGDTRRPARRRADADPRRRRRLRLELDGRDLERVLVRRRPVRRRQRADRRPRRLHEQPAVRCDARLRRRADVLRGRGADGQARGRARHRPGRAAAAERTRARRRARRPGRSSRGRCRRARSFAAPQRSSLPSRRSFRARRSACPEGRATPRGARGCGAASASPSASRTSATRRASTTSAPPASCSPRTARPRCTARPPRWARASSDVILQVARLELGTDDVTLASGSTARVGSAGSASASRMTWMAAGAVQTACRAALEERERSGEAPSTSSASTAIRARFRSIPETGQITEGTRTSRSHSPRCASSSRSTSSSASRASSGSGLRRTSARR